MMLFVGINVLWIVKQILLSDNSCDVDYPPWRLLSHLWVVAGRAEIAALNKERVGAQDWKFKEN